MRPLLAVPVLLAFLFPSASRADWPQFLMNVLFKLQEQ